jgi:hypothetical protein
MMSLLFIKSEEAGIRNLASLEDTESAWKRTVVRE